MQSKIKFEDQGYILSFTSEVFNSVKKIDLKNENKGILIEKKILWLKTYSIIKRLILREKDW